MFLDIIGVAINTCIKYCIIIIPRTVFVFMRHNIEAGKNLNFK